MSTDLRVKLDQCLLKMRKCLLIGHNYGQDHPMKPYRIRVTYSLPAHHGLLQLKHDVKSFLQEIGTLTGLMLMTMFLFESHHPRNITGSVYAVGRFNIGEYCPILMDSIGGSVGGAVNNWKI
ncbi:hypothetical protein F0562_012120 [Nyssa sinensis]|uniref:Uncharacterized protein n=1 Tax=Nyssa sinensis TaxID=561372 RepID=A0A5J4ZWI3_9ASTE|nr:hypothetical protein F0562_012120 [Nyssa sinensis]